MTFLLELCTDDDGIDDEWGPQMQVSIFLRILAVVDIVHNFWSSSITYLASLLLYHTVVFIL